MTAINKQVIMSHRYLVYSKPGCPYCDKAKALLDMKGVSWREINLETTEQQASFIDGLQGWRTFPAIFELDTADGKPIRFVGGFDSLLAEAS